MLCLVCFFFCCSWMITDWTASFRAGCFLRLWQGCGKSEEHSKDMESLPWADTPPVTYVADSHNHLQSHTPSFPFSHFFQGSGGGVGGDSRVVRSIGHEMKDWCLLFQARPSREPPLGLALLVLHPTLLFTATIAVCQHLFTAHFLSHKIQSTPFPTLSSLFKFDAREKRR